jgi:CspA family cold shock protein
MPGDTVLPPDGEDPSPESAVQAKGLSKGGHIPVEQEGWKVKFFRKVNSLDRRVVRRHSSDGQPYRYREFLTFEWMPGQVTFDDALLDSLAEDTAEWQSPWMDEAIEYVDQVWKDSAAKAAPAKATPAARAGRVVTFAAREGKVHHGRVKNWNEEKGFGFISPDDGSEDLFAHLFQVAEDAQHRGAQVKYNMKWNAGKDKWRAEKVTLDIGRAAVRTEGPAVEGHLGVGVAPGPGPTQQPASSGGKVSRAQSPGEWLPHPRDLPILDGGATGGTLNPQGHGPHTTGSYGLQMTGMGQGPATSGWISPHWPAQGGQPQSWARASTTVTQWPQQSYPSWASSSSHSPASWPATAYSSTQVGSLPADPSVWDEAQYSWTGGSGQAP